jgi:hypothetical protein
MTMNGLTQPSQSAVEQARNRGGFHSRGAFRGRSFGGRSFRGGTFHGPRFYSGRRFYGGRRFHHVRPFRHRGWRRRGGWGIYAAPFWYGGYYGRNCGWLRARAIATGSAYWWRRYRICRYYY